MILKFLNLQRKLKASQRRMILFFWILLELVAAVTVRFKVFNTSNLILYRSLFFNILRLILLFLLIIYVYRTFDVLNRRYKKTVDMLPISQLQIVFSQVLFAVSSILEILFVSTLVHFEAQKFIVREPNIVVRSFYANFANPINLIDFLLIVIVQVYFISSLLVYVSNSALKSRSYRMNKRKRGEISVFHFLKLPISYILTAVSVLGIRLIFPFGFSLSRLSITIDSLLKNIGISFVKYTYEFLFIFWSAIPGVIELKNKSMPNDTLLLPSIRGISISSFVLLVLVSIYFTKKAVKYRKISTK